MEKTPKDQPGSKAPADSMSAVFDLLKQYRRGATLEAVQMLQRLSKSMGARFAAAFDAQSKAEEDKSFQWQRQLSALMNGALSMTTAFPELFTLLLRPRFKGRGAGTQAVMDVFNKMATPGGNASPTIVKSLLTAFQGLADERTRAETWGELWRLLFRIGAARKLGNDMLQMQQHGFSGAWAATVWMGFIKCGGSYVRRDVDLPHAAQLFLNCTPNETVAITTLVDILIEDTRGNGRPRFGNQDLQPMLQRLQALRAWPALEALLETSLFKTVFLLLVPSKSPSFWQSMRERDCLRSLVRELVRDNDIDSIELILENWIETKESNPRLIRELTRGLRESRCKDETVWDMLLTLLEQLDARTATLSCLTMASSLWKLDMFGRNRRQRMFDVAWKWRPQKQLRYLLRMIIGAQGNFGPTIWEFVLDLVKSPEIRIDAQMAEDLVRAAFQESDAWQPAPDDVAIKLLNLLAASKFAADPTALVLTDRMPCRIVLEWLPGKDGHAALVPLMQDQASCVKLLCQCAKISPDSLHLVLSNTKGQVKPELVLKGLCQVMALKCRTPAIASIVVDALKDCGKDLPDPLSRIAMLVIDAVIHGPGPASEDPMIGKFGAPLSQVLQCIDLAADESRWQGVPTSELRGAYAHILASAASGGSLQLENIPGIKDFHAELQHGFPNINWNYVNQGIPKPLTTIHISLQETIAVLPLGQAIVNAIDALLQQSARDQGHQQAIMKALAPHVKPLLSALMPGSSALAAIDPSTIAALVNAVQSNPGFAIGVEVFDHLLDPTQSHLSPAFVADVQALEAAGQQFLQNDALDCVDALAQALDGLADQVESAAFQMVCKHWDKHLGSYQIEVIRKNDPECLFLGQGGLTTDLSPWKESGHLLIACLTRPYVLVGVRDGRGKLVMLAKCALCRLSGTPILICDKIDMSPVCFDDMRAGFRQLSRVGEILLEKLMSQLVVVRQAIGVKRVVVPWSALGDLRWGDFLDAPRFEIDISKLFLLDGTRPVMRPSHAPYLQVGALQIRLQPDDAPESILDPNSLVVYDPERVVLHLPGDPLNDSSSSSDTDSDNTSEEDGITRIGSAPGSSNSTPSSRSSSSSSHS